MKDGEESQHPDDAEEIAKAKKAAKKVREHELDDLKAILGMPEGRNFLWRLITEARVFKAAWDPSANKMAHTVGKQDLGKWIISELEGADQEAYFLMMKEANNG